MQNNTLVSVIIPVYNVENYLCKCLDSVVAQTYKNIEVILVDDGSFDRCGQICDEYARKYPIMKVIHQSNKGLSEARNNGIKVAKGEFITFIDSDDYIENDYIEYLTDLQKQYNADIAIGGYRYVYEGSKKSKHSHAEKIVLMTAEEALIRMNYTDGFGATAWAKLYRREIVLQYPYPKGKLYEDLATTYKIFSDARTIVFGSRVIYYWVQRKGSIMRRIFDERQLDGIEAANEQLKFIESNYPSGIMAAKYRCVAKAVELMALNFRSGGDIKVYQKLKDYMNDFIIGIVNDSNVRVSMKLRIWSIQLGYLPAKGMFFLHEKIKRIIFGMVL